MILAAFIIMSCGVKAQSGMLVIDNTTNPCGVYITMHASDFSASPADLPCKTYSNQFYVAPYSTAPFPTLMAFETAVGWASPTPLIPMSSAGFMWTDVTFQFNCNACSNTGGSMSNTATTYGIGTCFPLPTTTAWYGTGTGTCYRWATWADNPGGMYSPLDNITLTFH